MKVRECEALRSATTAQTGELVPIYEETEEVADRDGFWDIDLLCGRRHVMG
jgi:hypothetical protein